MKKIISIICIFLMFGILNLTPFTNLNNEINVTASGLIFNINSSSPILFNETPTDNKYDVTANDLILSVLIDDPDSNTISWSIETSPNIGYNSGICSTSQDDICNATCIVSGLYGNLTYKWFVNVSDGVNDINATYSFTTKDYIAVIGKIGIIPTNNERMPAEAEIEASHGVIKNWTGRNHKIRLNWHVINNYQVQGTKTIWIRVAEWDAGDPLKFLYFFLPMGEIQLKGFNPDLFDFPKLLKVDIPYNGESYESGFFDYEIIIKDPYEYIEMAIMIMDKNPGGIFPFSADMGGYHIYLPPRDPPPV
jgi:hypothetical protein